MSTLFITNIVGTGTYAVPTNDTELANAQAGLAALLGGVAGLTFNAVLAWVDINSGTTTRILNCFVSNYQYNGEICPDDTEFAAMVAAINAALVADPNITSASVQYSSIESSPTSPPAPHETSHLSGGSDAISSVAGLTGLLATAQTPAAHNLGGAEHNADTLANLNLKISDATLVDGGPVLSNLWAAPSIPQPEDEEFDSGGDLPGAFAVHNLTAGAPAAFGPGSPTPYINPPSMRAVSNIPTRLSWGFLQPEAGSPLYYIYKPYFSFPPAAINHVLMARMKFNQILTPAANDATIGIAIAAQSVGFPDNLNYVGIYLNKTSAGVRAELSGVVGGAPAGPFQSSPLTAEGQALEYVALHLFPPVFHGWAGTAAGNWIYLGNIAAAPLTPFYYGMLARNGATASPGSCLLGIDFLRVHPGDSTFLF